MCFGVTPFIQFLSPFTSPFIALRDKLLLLLCIVISVVFLDRVSFYWYDLSFGNKESSPPSCPPSLLISLVLHRNENRIQATRTFFMTSNHINNMKYGNKIVIRWNTSAAHSRYIFGGSVQLRMMYGFNIHAGKVHCLQIPYIYTVSNNW